jgi:hypothetical protein
MVCSIYKDTATVIKSDIVLIKQVKEILLTVSLELDIKIRRL